MDSPLFDLNQLPNSSQSTEISSPGLDDFDSNGASFFGTNNIIMNEDNEVNQVINILELNTEGGSLESDIQVANNIIVNTDNEVNEVINVLELNTEGGSLQSDIQVSKKELTEAERKAAYHCLLEKIENGVLKRGRTREVALKFGVRIRSIQRLWKRARESGNHDYQNHRVKNCGRKRIECDLERIRDIPLSERTTISSLAQALGVSMQFLNNRLKDGSIRRHSNAIMPLLTQDNLISRMKHCISNIDPTSVPHQPSFYHMHNTVHIDEKWFFLTKRSQRYYLLRNETDPVRTSKNSNFIPKVMFLAVVARPRFDSNDICTFDGKIGVFPLVESVAAVRSSHNRPRGTIVIKPITNITRNVIREFMIGKVLPAIANKWPRDSIMERIFIQQDNAKTHIHSNDVEFLRAVEASGLNVSLVCQPPNSPDLNVLDLEFFRAIQSLQSKTCAKSVVDLIAAVEDAYQNFSHKKSNYIFLTLQTCMIEVLKCQGSNAYKIPHIRKKALERLRDIPSTIQCPLDVYANAVALISP